MGSVVSIFRFSLNSSDLVSFCVVGGVCFLRLDREVEEGAVVSVVEVAPAGIVLSTEGGVEWEGGGGGDGGRCCFMADGALWSLVCLADSTKETHGSLCVSAVALVACATPLRRCMMGHYFTAPSVAHGEATEGRDWPDLRQDKIWASGFRVSSSSGRLVGSRSGRKSGLVCKKAAGEEREGTVLVRAKGRCGRYLPATR